MSSSKIFSNFSMFIFACWRHLCMYVKYTNLKSYTLKMSCLSVLNVDYGIVFLINCDYVLFYAFKITCVWVWLMQEIFMTFFNQLFWIPQKSSKYAYIFTYLFVYLNSFILWAFLCFSECIPRNNFKSFTKNTSNIFNVIFVFIYLLLLKYEIDIVVIM